MQQQQVELISPLYNSSACRMHLSACLPRRYDAGCTGTDYTPASHMTLPPGSLPLSPEVGRGTACMDT